MQALKINGLLCSLFEKAGIRLVDFKLEFGRCDGDIILCDEISPDFCRFWDMNTGEKLDKEALLLIKKLLVNTVAKLCEFADKHKAMPCLAYTHFQAAQPTTVGKRATLWIQDLLLDLEQLDFTIESLKLLGCKGTTDTGASFLALFDGNHDKVKPFHMSTIS